MKRVLMIEDSAVVLKALLDVFYPRWSPFSVDYRVTISGGEAKRLGGGNAMTFGGEVLRRAFTTGVIRPGTKIVAISGMPTSNEQTTPKC